MKKSVIRKAEKQKANPKWLVAPSLLTPPLSPKYTRITTKGKPAIVASYLFQTCPPDPTGRVDLKGTRLKSVF